MKLNKLLYIVTEKEYLSDLKKVDVKNFLFPLKDFCVGYPNTYDIDEIEENSFILINRILDNKSLDKLESILKDIKNIKGIVFDDFGVLYLINKLKLNVETILFQNHFGTNYQSINNNLEYVDSVVVSTDITKDEITEILDKTCKPLTIFAFGLTAAMYSRRKLLSNFYEEFNLNKDNNVTIHEKISNNDFIMVENEYGVVGYQKNYYNGFELFENDSNVKYFLINPLFLSKDSQLELIDNIKNSSFNLNILNDTGFLYKPTIYKIKEDSNE